MAKYKVEIGGFVSTFRKRNLVVHANSEEEAKEKAKDKFIDLQQERPGSMCTDANVDSIEEV